MNDATDTALSAHDWTPRPWHWIGAAVGAAGGLFDVALASLLGVDMRLGGVDATVGVLAFLTVSNAGLGYLIGRLFQERSRARRDGQIIERQLRELERTQRELVQQEKLAAIGRVAAGVAHEVRNPLGVIRASASMVQESFEPEQDPYRACEFICEEIDRLNSIITSLLSLSRPTQLRRRTMSIDKVVERALHLASEDLTARRIDAMREAESVDTEISADPDLVCQVVYGLLSNAGEAIGEAGRVVVRTRTTRDAVEIEVADSGAGVAAETALHVFEPFFTTKSGGTGLGLPIAERVARAHGGSLAFLPGAGAGADGRGACFRLRLPSDAGRLEMGA
jgi:signal transduction histidine kinase